MSHGLALLDVSDGIATITLNDGARLNPLGQELIADLGSVVGQINNDQRIRAVIMTGIGRAFSVGADLADYKEMVALPEPKPDLGTHIGELMAALNTVILDLKTLPIPVVVAINGPAAGGGVGLALAGDMSIAARSAYFYLPFLPSLGVVPDMAVSWVMTRTVGRARGLGIALTGDKLSAEKAAEWGLIWACVDDNRLHTKALDLAKQLAQLPAHAILEARALFASAETSSLAGQLAYERSRQVELARGASFTEGILAFSERRKPVFRTP